MAGRTFAFGESGPEGLLKGKRPVVLRASGSDFDNPAFAPMDFHAPCIRGVLGWIGITDVEIIAVNGYAPEQVEAATGRPGALVAGAAPAFAFVRRPAPGRERPECRTRGAGTAPPLEGQRVREHISRAHLPSRA